MAVNRKARKNVYGLTNALQNIGPLPIVAQRTPTTRDFAEVGTLWLDQAGNDAYILLEIVANSASWIATGSGAGSFDSVASTTFVTAGTTMTAATSMTVTAMAADGVLTNTAAGLFVTNPLTDGQILIGSTGAPAVAATLTAGAGIVIGNAAGAITVTATGAVASNYTADDANNVIPDGTGQIFVYGGVNAGTTAAIANTITVNVDDAPTFAGLVTAQAGITQSGGTAAITSDTNGAQAIYLHADGGVNETIEVYADQSTAANSIYIHSDLGGVNLASALAGAAALRLYASDAAGGIDIDAGTAGIAVDTTGALSLGSAAASNFTVTGAFDLTLDSTLGSVVIDGGEAVADAIQLTTSDAAGGITGAVGTGGYILGATNGPFTLETGTGNITIGADAAAKNISIGNATGATLIDLDAGTGACTILSNATDHSITFGSVTGVSALTTQTGTGAMTFDALGIYDVNSTGAVTIDSSAGTIGIGVDADAFDINIGTAASERIVTIGNATTATSVVLNAGTGAVNLGANGTVHTTTCGSAAGASITTLQAGTGALTLTAGGICDVNGTGNVTIDSTGGTLGIGEGADANNINIGTGAAARVVTIGNNTGASGVDVVTGTAGFSVNSGAIIDLTPGTTTQAGAAATLSVNVGVVTLTGLTTASAATQSLTITNTLVSATSGILCTTANLGANDARINVERVTPGAGSFVVDVINSGAAALNGSIILSFWVLN